jgi:hypothetical protein
MHLNQIPGLHLYLPTIYGDVKLTAQGSQTEVEWENLSPSERQAMDSLGNKYGVDTAASAGTVLVKKSIDKVEALLAKAMKRGRKLLTAVVFQGGRIEEVHRTGDGDEPKLALVKPVKEVAKAAVTVAAPLIGCPVPEFERADVRATRVLKAFLTPEQLADFDRTQAFLVTGGDSGHRYVLTSRQASRDRLAKVGGRSVYDLDMGLPICVHDWVVPAAEELLELKLFLELPTRERYATSLPAGHVHG